jgi:hypothetical protein
LCKAKEGGIGLCNEKVSRPPRIHMLVPPPLWRGFFFGPAPHPLGISGEVPKGPLRQEAAWRDRQ